MGLPKGARDEGRLDGRAAVGQQEQLRGVEEDAVPDGVRARVGDGLADEGLRRGDGLLQSSARPVSINAGTNEGIQRSGGDLKRRRLWSSSAAAGGGHGVGSGVPLMMIVAPPMGQTVPVLSAGQPGVTRPPG